uniref:Uncharacterized protein n=1 Tax=Arundo donax TaxID=35708 RepID=A0A0A9AFC0_ARUDO
MKPNKSHTKQRERKKAMLIVGAFSLFLIRTL